MCDGEGLTPSEAKEIKDAFELFDKDDNKKICTKELGSVLRAIGLNPTKKELEDSMKKYDVNNSGFIEYEEYLKCIESFELNPQEIKVQLRQAFLFFDKNKDGQLNIEELKNVLTAIGEPLGHKTTCEILKLADVNGDGKLSANEFTEFLCQKV